MTCALSINCSDGIVVACDSLVTYGRGVPVLRYSNKVHILTHDGLENPVVIAAAGLTTYFDKFRDRACRQGIDNARQGPGGRQGPKLDVVDVVQEVCEPIMTGLLREYSIDRLKFLGVPLVEFSLSLIVAGATRDGELRSYLVHYDGVSETIDHYGTIGSGAAYAELFLRFLLAGPRVDVSKAGRLSEYAVKGVELMDPNVGGDVNVKMLRMANNKLQISDPRQRPPKPREKMEAVLRKIGSDIEGLVDAKEGRGAKNIKKKDTPRRHGRG